MASLQNSEKLSVTGVEEGEHCMPGMSRSLSKGQEVIQSDFILGA